MGKQSLPGISQPVVPGGILSLPGRREAEPGCFFFFFPARPGPSAQLPSNWATGCIYDSGLRFAQCALLLLLLRRRRHRRLILGNEGDGAGEGTGSSGTHSDQTPYYHDVTGFWCLHAMVSHVELQRHHCWPATSKESYQASVIADKPPRLRTHSGEHVSI